MEMSENSEIVYEIKCHCIAVWFRVPMHVHRAQVREHGFFLKVQIMQDKGCNEYISEDFSLVHVSLRRTRFEICKVL